MPSVYVFSSRSRFATEDEFRRFIEPTYTDDGNCLDSPFMREVDSVEFEPRCIEAVFEVPAPLPVLLEGMPYSEHWLPRLTCQEEADAAVCAFSPNQLRSPEKSSLRYHGAFEFQP